MKNSVALLSRDTPSLVNRFLCSAPAVLLILLAFYVLMFQRYRAYDIDNPWFLSFSWNYKHAGVVGDEFGGAHFPQGMDGVRLFGKIPASLQCLVLDRTGWTPFPAMMLSSLLTVASLALWWLALHKMGLHPRLIGTFVLLLGLTGPFVSMAEKCRYEFWAFFMASLGLVLGLYGFEFTGMAVSFVGAEAEPIAMAAALGVATVLFVPSRTRLRLPAKFAAAALCGAALYVVLHPHALHELLHSLRQMHSVVASALYAWFWERKRNLVYLLVLTIGVVLYLKSGRIRQYPEIGWAAGVLIVVLALNPHPNVSYTVFVMPFLLLMALLGYEYRPRLAWLPMLLAVALLTRYGYLAWNNRNEGYSPADIHAVSAMVHEAENRFHYDDNIVRIVGDYSLWYIHPRNYFASFKDVHGLQTGDLYLCYPSKLQDGELSRAGMVGCSELQQSISLTQVRSMVIHNHTLYLYRHPK